MFYYIGTSNAESGGVDVGRGSGTSPTEGSTSDPRFSFVTSHHADINFFSDLV